jgi:hypothetical protein
MQSEWWHGAGPHHRSNFNITTALSLTGDLDVAALRQALRDLTARHEILRTSFAPDGADVVQLVHRQVEPEVWQADLRGRSDPQRELERMLLTDSGDYFDLTTAPLWRATLARLDDRRHVLAFEMNHIICDGWSTLVAAQDLVRLYEGIVSSTLPRLPAMELQMGDFAVWERKDADADAVAHWRDRLRSPAPPHALPVDPGWPGDGPYRLVCHPFPPLPPRVGQRLLQLADDLGVSRTSTVHTAALLTVAPYLGDETIFGMAFANRGREELANVMGPMSCILPLRVPLHGDPTFAELAQRADDERRLAMPHVQPLARVVRAGWTEPRVLRYDVAANVIPDGGARGPREVTHPNGSVVAFEPYALSNSWRRIAFSRVTTGAAILHFAVRLSVDGVTGEVVANSAALPYHTVSAVGRRFSALLDLVAQRPDSRAADVPAHLALPPWSP